MCLIDDYVDQLRAVLRGPRRAKEDLLEEAAGHLLDASAVHADAGVPAEVAHERAVSEFGPVGLVAPGYQEELDLVLAQRTAVAMLIGVGIQPLIWQGLWPQVVQAPVFVGDPAQEAVERLAAVFGTLGLVVGLLGVIAARTGVRVPRVRRHVVKAIGMAGLIVSATVTGSALLMTALTPDPSRFLQVATAPSLLLFVMMPMAAIAHSARRCVQRR